VARKSKEAEEQCAVKLLRAPAREVAGKNSPEPTLPEMIGPSALTQDDFDNLLIWLHPDRERAAQKYAEIHESLVKIFSWRGYYDAEDLADEVVNRVTSKVREIADGYVGDPALYFYGVAKKVLLECDRRESHRPLTPDMNVPNAPAPQDEADEGTRLRECLRKCLRELDPGEREMILSYYRKSKQAKIDYRKAIAEQLDIGTNALRVRVYRIRAGLKECMKKCLGTHRALK
jgi:RNA polymerase sigma factor (sigma-70 family)